MGNFKWQKLQQVILDFVQNEGSQYKYLEMWIDTTVAKTAKKSPSLYLVFHAFNTNEKFDEVIQKVVATEDFSLIADCTDGVSKQIWFEFAEIDEKISAGDVFLSSGAEQEMISAILQLIEAEPQAFQHLLKIFFYWIGNTHFTWIRK